MLCAASQKRLAPLGGTSWRLDRPVRGRAREALLTSATSVTEQQDPYARARLVLEYLRAFAWPVVVLVILGLYGKDLIGMVGERGFEAFGVRFGPRIEEVQEQVEAELADVRHLLERQKSAPEGEREQITEDLTNKVEKLGENVTRAVDQIRQFEEPEPAGRQAAAQASIGRRTDAQRLTRDGFQALIDRDAGRALAVFDEAHELWPTYQNVAEIRALLRREIERLQDKDSAAWKEVYRRILTDYSWGMSQQERATLREALY